VVPYPAQDGTGAHHLFPIRIKNGKRDHVKAYLNERGIGAQVHYPSIHLQPYYRERFGWKAGDFPEAEAWADEELSLPLHAQMDEADVGRVVETLKEALN
jgi:dTDP-4-amino-4,6-dideoxygalactose transaminase